MRPGGAGRTGPATAALLSIGRASRPGWGLAGGHGGPLPGQGASGTRRLHTNTGVRSVGAQQCSGPRPSNQAHTSQRLPLHAARKDEVRRGNRLPERCRACFTCDCKAVSFTQETAPASTGQPHRKNGSSPLKGGCLVLLSMEPQQNLANRADNPRTCLRSTP